MITKFLEELGFRETIKEAYYLPNMVPIIEFYASC